MSGSIQDVSPQGRDELENLLKQYEQHLKIVTQKKETQDLERGKFMERFQVLARTEWARTFEEIANTLGSAGHRSVVQLSQDRFTESLTMKIEPNANTPFSPSTECSLRITPNEARLKISFKVVKVDSISSSGDEEMYSLEELTPQKFRALIVRGIAQILQSSLPR